MREYLGIYEELPDGNFSLSQVLRIKGTGMYEGVVMLVTNSLRATGVTSGMLIPFDTCDYVGKYAQGFAEQEDAIRFTLMGDELQIQQPGNTPTNYAVPGAIINLKPGMDFERIQLWAPVGEGAEDHKDFIDMLAARLGCTVDIGDEMGGLEQAGT